MIENNPLVRKLGAFVALSDPELSVLASLHKRRRTFVAGRDLVHQGQSDQAAYTLASGWACSYKLLEDGQKQIVDFQIPGDFLGLRSVLMHVSDHSIEPVTDIEVTEILVSDLLDAFARKRRGWPRRYSGPRRATRRWWSSTWWIWDAAMRPGAWRISCWNWAPDLSLSEWATGRATRVRSRNTIWPMRLD
jgi:hypothetical protein